MRDDDGSQAVNSRKADIRLQTMLLMQFDYCKRSGQGCVADRAQFRKSYRVNTFHHGLVKLAKSTPPLRLVVFLGVVGTTVLRN